MKIDEYYWSCPNVGGYVPTPRSDFAFASNQSNMHSEILIFGGKMQVAKDSFLYVLSEMGNLREKKY